MTDEQIIKALEVCASKEIRCNECPFDEGCANYEIKYLLDLINRQKAEIEKLNIEFKAMRDSANSYKAEVERLKKHIQDGVEFEIEYNIKEIRAEAIKEFWERVRRYAIDMGYVHVTVFGDNLVKEMTEE